jgi:alkylation response protein AidB-like acyl-CoA dehydrogenase
VLALGVTERNGGGGRDLSSRGEETDGGWSISGEKHLITFGAFASDIILLVATDERKAADSFSAFMLPTDIGGFVVEREQETMGLPGIGLAALRFDCMRAADDQMLGPQGRGLEVMGSFLDYSRISLCSCMVGFAQSALDEAVRFAHSRTTFGRPITDRQAIQVQLADAFADITAARALVSDLAGHADAGERIGVLSAAGKLFCQQMVSRVTDHALRVHGGLGYTKDAAISRIYEESRAFWFEEGTAETQQIIIARSLMPA